MNTDLADWSFQIRVDRRKSAALKFRRAGLWQRAISLVPGRSLLIRKRQLQNQIFAPRRARDLQSYGQPTLRESARNRNRRQPPYVEWSRIPQQLQFCRAQRFWTRLELCD